MKNKQNQLQDGWLIARNNHTYENGRRYYGYNSEHPFPDDTKGLLAHSILNIIWYHLLGEKMFVSPIGGDGQLRKNHKLLEFATRSGSWANALLAERWEQQHQQQQQQQRQRRRQEPPHPGPRLTSMDSMYMSTPTNWSYFIHHELEAEWPFTSKQAFHLIHAQSLGGILTDHDGFYARAHRHLVPGGWLEVWENDFRFFTESNNEQDEEKLVALRQWETLMEEAADTFGKRINVAAVQKVLMLRAGFVEVDEQVFKVPLGQWSDDQRMNRAGQEYRYQMHCALEGYTLRLFTKTLGWSKEDTDVLLGRVRKELDQEEVRLYSNFHLIRGKKSTESAR
ncbi:hypothetical protein FE257_004611 [Aspergillus nanangensis]|uniref:Uncharacterized protein n=1 Tax=Aspergillus nanangensis TaxID=2582783 RepID=A0AAD4GZE4_ASPNN|nr:hypothetical protein FE257_004611 [Aspergillus nanangensis]